MVTHPFGAPWPAWELTKDNRIETPKTEKSNRRVPIPEPLSLKMIERKLARGAGYEAFVFASLSSGRPPSQGNWRRRGWNPVVEAAKLGDGPKVTPHDARHAFVSQAADFGLSSDDVAGIVGHTSSKVTEGIYKHAFQPRRARAATARGQGPHDRRRFIGASFTKSTIVDAPSRPLSETAPQGAVRP